MLTVIEALESKGLSIEGMIWEKVVPVNQQTHYWHDRQICKVSRSGIEFSIHATRVNQFMLIDKATADLVISYNEIWSHSTLEDELKGYIATDEELLQAIEGTHPKYRLHFGNKCGYECLIIHEHDLYEVFEVDAPKLIDVMTWLNQNLDQMTANVLAGVPIAE